MPQVNETSWLSIGFLISILLLMNLLNLWFSLPDWEKIKYSRFTVLFKLM